MRTTININDNLFKTLKIQAIEADISVSKLIEEAVANQLLEDAEDLEDSNSRQNEPELKFDDLVKQFRSEGLI